MTKNNLTKSELIRSLQNVDDDAIIVLDENSDDSLLRMVSIHRVGKKQKVVLRDYIK